MKREELAKLAEIFYHRKEEVVKREISIEEQEFTRFFIWLMEKLEYEVENSDPPQGKIVKSFDVYKSSDISVTVSTNGRYSNTFISYPGLRDPFETVAACIDFIETLEGFEIINRFPKDRRQKVERFMLVMKYNNM